MKGTYEFHIDPGHSWLKVPYGELQLLGIRHDISKYSYRKGADCYLEEDCDAPRFADAYKAYVGSEPKFKEVLHDLAKSPPCFIRNLNRYFV